MKAEIKSIQRVVADTSYNAFTDLAFFNGKFWLTYRSGIGHVKGDGIIHILSSTDLTNWRKQFALNMKGVDLRDPKFFSIDSDSNRPKLGVLAFGLNKITDYRYTIQGSSIWQISADSKNGEEIGERVQIIDDGIIWRITEHKGNYYGAWYTVTQGHMQGRIMVAESGSPKGPWRTLINLDDSVLPYMLGYTEFDIIFDAEDTMYIFSRTDKDSLHGAPSSLASRLAMWRHQQERKHVRIQKLNSEKNNGEQLVRKESDYCFVFASSKPPYSEWKYHTYDFFLHAPKVIHSPIDAKSFLISGRIKSEGKDGNEVMKLGIKLRDVGLYQFTLDTKEMKKIISIDQGGDSSYTGMVMNPSDPNELIISFYSDSKYIGTLDKGKRNDIWVARVQLKQD